MALATVTVLTSAKTEEATGGLPVHHSLVGVGELPGHAGHLPVVNPADGRAFAEVSLLDRDQAGAALEAARAAFPAARLPTG